MFTKESIHGKIKFPYFHISKAVIRRNDKTLKKYLISRSTSLSPLFSSDNIYVPRCIAMDKLCPLSCAMTKLRSIYYSKVILKYNRFHFKTHSNAFYAMS